MSACEKCGSVFVHWNKNHITKEQRRRINPWSKAAPKDLWEHYCEYCNNTTWTNERMTGGLPTFIVKIAVKFINFFN